MVNTLSGAMSRVRLVNWGRLIHKYVERSIPHIGRKPSYLFPYILHLYQYYNYFTRKEEDQRTIAEDELNPEAKMAEIGVEDSSNTLL